MRLPERNSKPKVSSSPSAYDLRNVGESENILFFIHENSNGKQHGRKRMFDAWYRKASTDMLLKQDAEINIGRFSILASILLRKDHPHLEAVLSGFEALVMEAGEKPD